MNEELLRLAQIAKDYTGLGVVYIKDSEIRTTRSRKFDAVMIKACIINILRHNHKLGVSKIGNMMGFDHTTVIHHVQAHDQRYQYEPEYKDLYDVLRKESEDKNPYFIDVDEVVQMIREIA